ncbi:MAG: NAD(P)/FAD-dependent oxidoreductase [Candidatus Aminicenantes bacterium]|nr:NAD(P)/FAD-dependent oxidoreductase [Candidatus Aminicenantes bacterium]
MDKSEITIIGAGVVGLAIGAELARNGREVVVLEKNLSYGQETSSRNSEVIHAGLYYDPDSLKARFCVRGNHRLYELCRENNIDFRNTEKLVVARNEEEMIELQRLVFLGESSGAGKLVILDKNQLKKIEPEIKGYAALLSTTTGIIDSHALMNYYVKTIEDNGGILVYNSEVTAIDRRQGGYILHLAKDNYSFFSRIVINSSGLHADLIAEKAGIDIDRSGYRLLYCKGEYFSLRKKVNVGRLIYGIPYKDGLGIHLVISLGGETKFGPNHFYVNSIDYNVSPEHKEEFYSACHDYFSDINREDLFPDISGIRPRLAQEKYGFRDFIIQEESDKDLPGLINLIGIESPGLTAAPAIGEFVADLIKLTDR